MQKPPSATEFSEFMRAYQDMVFSTAVRLTANAAQAEDIAQDVFLKAYEQFEQLKASPAAGGWLKTVARNLSLNHLSRYRRRWRFFSEMSTGGAADEAEATDFLFAPDSLADDLFEGLEADYRRQQLEAGLAQLPDHQRVPLVLYHFEDLSYDEIARQLRVSIPKLKTDLYRARVQLARRLLDARDPHGNR